MEKREVVSCKHDFPRHLIEKFDTEGIAEEFWMCCGCGEIVGRYKNKTPSGVIDSA